MTSPDTGRASEDKPCRPALPLAACRRFHVPMRIHAMPWDSHPWPVTGAPRAL